MKKTPEELRQEGEALMAAGRAKIAAAERDEAAAVQAQTPAISPRTKLPVEHPESQAVERAHYEMQTSLNSRPGAEAEIAARVERPKE